MEWIIIFFLFLSSLSGKWTDHPWGNRPTPSNEGARWQLKSRPFCHATSSFPPPPLFLPFPLCHWLQLSHSFESRNRWKTHYFPFLFLLLLQVMNELRLIEWLIERIFDLIVIPLKAEIDERLSIFLSFFSCFFRESRRKNLPVSYQGEPSGLHLGGKSGLHHPMCRKHLPRYATPMSSLTPAKKEKNFHDGVHFVGSPNLSGGRTTTQKIQENGRTIVFLQQMLEILLGS